MHHHVSLWIIKKKAEESEHHTDVSSTLCTLKYAFIYIICLFVCFSYRMRDRGPCICGVGVWSLLFSLCLASLTHAHRSHTGRLMCLYMHLQSRHSCHLASVRMLCTLLDLLRIFPAGGLCSHFLFTRHEVGISRLCATWGDADIAFTMEEKTAEVGCLEHMKCSWILERRTKVFQQERSSQFRGIHVPSVSSKVASHQNAWRLQHWQWAL